MNFSARKLLDALTLAAPPSGTRHPKAQVLLSSSLGRLSISMQSIAYDLTASITSLDLLPDEVEGVVLHPPLVAFIKSILAAKGKKDEREVSLAIKGDELIVTSGGSSITLPLVTDADLLEPVVRPEEGGSRLEGLTTALERAKPFAAEFGANPSFSVVAIERSEERSVVVATDGFRLASFDLEGRLPHSVYLPLEALDPIARQPEDDLTLWIEGEGTHLLVCGENFALRLGLREMGKWVEWRRVVPEDSGRHVHVTRASFLDVIKRAEPLVDKNANHRLDLTFEVDRFSLIAEGAYGTSREQLSMTQGCADPLPSLAVNREYLHEVLRHLSSPDVDFYGATANTPLVFVEPGARLLLVPLRTS